MAAIVRAALDVMGGDKGAEVVIPGADILLARRPDIRFVLFGDQAAVMPVLDRYPRVKDASTFTHTDISVRMDDRPSHQSAWNGTRSGHGQPPGGRRRRETGLDQRFHWKASRQRRYCFEGG